MNLSILGLFAVCLCPQAEGVVIERTVRSISIDPLGKRREVEREEVLRIRGRDVVIEDLTFGERLIIRPDVGKVWKADLLAGEYSELTIEEAAGHRRRLVKELRAAQKRVEGTAAGEEIARLLEGLDQFSEKPKVDLQSEGKERRLILNGNLVRLSVEVDPKIEAPGYLRALSAIGAFPAVVSEKFDALGGFPIRGTLRYVLFLDRVIDRFKVTASRRENIPDSVFTLPAGLKKVPWPRLEPPPERNPEKPKKFGPVFGEDDLDREKK